MKLYHVILTVLIISGCSPSIQQSTSSSTGYDEDVSSYRPVIPEMVTETENSATARIEDVEYVEPTEHLRVEIDSILRLKGARNEGIGYLPGFTIQVYTGMSREDANRAKNLVYDILIDEEPVITYDQPMFRVKVGHYYTRLEAEMNFNLLRKRFRQALVLPEKISLKE